MSTPRPTEVLLQLRPQQADLPQRLASVTSALSLDQLNWRPGPKQWSILECAAHLVIVNDMYLSEMRKCPVQSPNPAQPYQSNWFGRLVIWIVKTKPDGTPVKRFPAPPSMNVKKSQQAEASNYDHQQLEKLNAQLRELVELTERYAEADWNVRFKGDAPFVKMRLGDGLRITTEHNFRHISQMQRVRNNPAFPG